jgi:hypothetical protein
MPGLYRRPPQPQRRRPTIPVEGPLQITCDLIDGGAVVSALVDVPQQANLTWYHPVTVESVGTGAYTASASTLDVPIPAGAVAGDFLYLYMAWDSPSDAITVGSVPSGWSSQNGNTGYGLGTHIYWRYHNGTDTQATVGTSGTTKIRGVIIAFDNGVPEDPPTYGSWAPGGWTGGNVAEVLAFPAAFSTYKETNPTCLIVIDGNDAITNPEGTQTTLFDSGSGTTMRMVVFRGPVFRQPYTVYSDIPGFWVSYGTVQDIKYQRVYINNKAATQHEKFYPALIDGGAAIYALGEIKHYHHVQPALIDGGATVYSLASVYPDQFVSPDLIDGVSAIYGPSVVKAPYPITVGLIDSGAAIYGITVVKAPYPVTVGLIDSGAAIYDTTVVHQALPIVEGTSSGVDASSTTTHVFNLPSGVQAGDLIFFIATANASTGGITPPVDWLPNTDDTDPSYLGYGGGIIALSYYKIAAGGETTVSFSTVNSMRYHYIAYRISGAWDGYPGDPVSPMELWAGTSYPYATGTSANPDPPSVLWPADRDTVWIAVALSLSANVATAAPSGYSGLVTTPALTNADTISTAHRVVRRSTSEDPGVFTLVYGYWNAYTIGVRGKYFGAQGLALMRLPDGPSSVIYGLTLTKYNTVAPALIDGVSAIYGTTVIRAPYPITLDLIDGGAAIYDATVQSQAALIEPALIDGVAAIYALGVVPDQFVTLDLIDGVSAIYGTIVVKAPYPITLSLIDPLRVLVVDDTFSDAGTGVADLSTHTPELGGPWVRAFGGGNYPNAGFIDIDKDNDWAEPSGTITQGAWDYGSSVYRAGQISDGFVEGRLDVGSNGGKSGLVIRQSGASYYDNFYVFFGGSLYRMTGGVISYIGNRIYSGPWYRLEVSGTNPTQITLRSASTREGLDSASGTVYSGSTAGNQMASGYVGVYGTTEDQNGMVYSGPIDGFRAYSREAIFPLAVQPDQFVSPALIDGGAAIYDATVVPAPLSVTLALIDGAADIYSLSLRYTQTITADLIDGGAVVYGLLIESNTIVTALIDGGAAIYALEVQPDQSLTLALVDGAAEIYTASVVRAAWPITVALIDASGAIYSASVVKAPYPITVALIDGAAAIYALTVIPDQLVTPDLIDGGAAVYASSVVKAPYPITLAQIDGVAAVYGLGVIPDQFVTPALIDGVAAIYAASVVRAAWPITVALIDGAGAIYAASVVYRQTITAALIDGNAAIYAAIVAQDTIVTSLIDGGATVYGLQVQPDQSLTLALIDGAGDIYTLSVVRAPWPVTVGLIDAAGGIYAILVTYRNYITVDLIDGAAAIYDATVVPGSATITTALIDGGATPFAIIAEGGTTIATDLIDGAATVYDLSVLAQPVTVTLDLLGADGENYAITVAQFSNLTLDLIDGAAEIYSVSLVEIRNITLALIDSVSALYPPAFTFNVTLDLIDGGAWVWYLVTYNFGQVEGFSEVSFGWSTTGAGSAPVLGPAESTFTWRSDGWGAYAAIFGTGASGWGWAAYGGAGSEEMRGSGAPAFDWDTSSAAYVLHPSDSSFTFATAGEGSIPILGPSDVSFVWLPFAAGQVGITGTSASSFAKFTTSGTGAAGAVGTGASSYNWTTGASEGAVAEEVTGTGASDFNWQDSTGVGWHVEDDSVIGYSDVAFNWEAVSTTQIVPGTGFVSGGAGDTTWVTITS